MIYKFILLSDEVDNFMREIQIDSEATFMELHDAILDSVGYAKDQITSFFVCDDYWEKEQEITQIEMETSSEYDNYVMDETKLEELDLDEGQKMLFVYDMMNERSFFMELNAIVSGSLPMARCAASKGKAPKQVMDDLFIDIPEVKKGAAASDVDLYDDVSFDDEGFDEDDLEGLGYSDEFSDSPGY